MIRIRLGVVSAAFSLTWALSLMASNAAGPGTLEACSRAIPYTIEEPAGSVPADAKALVGTWVGYWNNTCSALVVQSVDADGTASVLYLFAVNPGASVSRVTNAKVMGKKLSFGSSRATLEFTLVGPDSLSGLHSGSYGSTTGNFSRK
ncbi:hypothetical protein [Reyranella sp.]|uniref:hypothetical protein n=1 Tax=Reyranella sp. TaxID=1929291 RepID=UPI0027303D2B|nr:hypothetical protein [Reyranella sp.]MDP2378246.1 hypothetical protein [Reyranella sp.]